MIFGSQRLQRRPRQYNSQGVNLHGHLLRISLALAWLPTTGPPFVVTQLQDFGRWSPSHAFWWETFKCWVWRGWLSILNGVIPLTSGAFRSLPHTSCLSLIWCSPMYNHMLEKHKRATGSLHIVTLCETHWFFTSLEGEASLMFACHSGCLGLNSEVRHGHNSHRDWSGETQAVRLRLD